jgi:hypothetical protein
MPIPVSVIHGARAPFGSPKVARVWMAALADHLESHGLGPVRSFEWNGGYLRSFVDRTHLDYAAHLLELVRSSRVTGRHEGGIQIFAKSNGAIVAERALNYLHSRGLTVNVRTLLRAGTPDPRPTPVVPGVDRIVTIVSADDTLYARGLRLGRLAGRQSGDTSRGSWQVFKTTGLSHHDFNYPRQLSLDNGYVGTTYDLYALLLKEGL